MKYIGTGILILFCFLAVQSFGQNFNLSFWKPAAPTGPSVQFSLASESVSEQNSAGVTLTITLSASQGTITTVPYVVTGTGVYGVNHMLGNGNIVFPIGVTTQTLSFSILDDNVVAGNKTVVVTLNPSGGIAAGSPSVNTLTIVEKIFNFTANNPGTGTIAVNEGGRSITINSLPSGMFEGFTLLENGVAATGFSCTGVPSAVATISGGVLSIDMGLQASNGTLSLSCTDSNGPLTINLNYLAARLRQVSNNPFVNGSDNSNPQVSSGNEWLVWEANGLAVSPYKQIVLRNLATGSIIFPATLDGTANTMPNTYTCCASFSLDARKLYFQSGDAIFAGANGKYQVYSKDLTNLVAAPVLITTTDGTTAISHDVGSEIVSADGNSLIFDTPSTNLGADGTNSQVYSKSLTNLSAAPVMISTTDGTTRGAGGSSYMGGPTALVGGILRVPIQASATNFTSGSASYSLIYYKDMNNLTATPTLVSTTDGTTTGTANIYALGLNPSGTKMMLLTDSAAWPGANGNTQIYEKDLGNLSLAPKIISSTNGSVAGNNLSFDGVYNSTGTRAVFRSYASNFPAGNIQNSVFVKDITDFTIPPVLASGVDATTLGNSYVTLPTISANNKIYFDSMSTNYPFPNGGFQIYQKDYLNLNSAPVLMSGIAGAGKGNSGNYIGFPKFSSDSTKVIFEGCAGNFQGNEQFKGQIYLKNLTGAPAAPVLISTDNGTNKGNSSDYFSGAGMGSQMSPDGTKIAFHSGATSFANSPGSNTNIYMKDLTAMTTNLVLIATTNGTTAASGSSFRPRFNPASTKIVFYASAGNFPGSNGNTQIYTKDLTNLTLAPVLISTTDGATAGTGASSNPIFSPDGTKIIFYSKAANFAGGNGTINQIYYKDLTNLTLAPVLISSTNGTIAGTADSLNPDISGDSTKVLFHSKAANFAGGDGATFQIYYKDLTNLTLAPVLVSSLDGAVPGNSNSMKASWAPDGSKIAFQSNASNFAGANGGNYQIYTKTIASLTTAPHLVSTVDGVNGGTNFSKNVVFSPDSAQLTFESYATEFPLSFSGQEEIYVGIP